MIDGLTQESPWFQGYVRAAAVHAQCLAALELLLLEQAGTTLAATATARVTREPVGGKPFVFDAATRQLAAPPELADLKVDPLALPW